MVAHTKNTIAGAQHDLDKRLKSFSTIFAPVAEGLSADGLCSHTGKNVNQFADQRIKG
jgi:hypothetical protein